MTLRATLEIVPYGVEINKYPLGYLDISNIGTGPDGIADYSATLYSDQGTELKGVSLQHWRSDGAWKLVKKVIEVLKL